MKLRALDPLLHPRYEDLLHKESLFVESFYEIVTQSIEPPFAISVDGPWGTGKTTVMKMLERKLRDEYCTFWFNPWEYRNTDSVVLAFLQSFAAEHKDRIDELSQSGGNILKVLLKSGIGAALKIYTKGNVSLKDLEKEFHSAEEEQKTSFDAYADSVQTIKKEFRELVEKVGAKYTQKTIFIFFDDLDRCLPADAIQLLEALKNLFVTPDCKVIFICGIDTGVAKSFISKHYSGIEENFAINYFRKIFNLTISMPANTQLYQLLLEYIKETLGLDDRQSDALANMIHSRGLQADMQSVRKYLNVVNNFYIFLKFNKSYSFNVEDDIIVYLLIMKEAWQPLYERLTQKAMKNQFMKMDELSNMLIADCREKGQLFPEQERFLTNYFIHPDRNFHSLILAELLLKYPALS